MTHPRLITLKDLSDRLGGRGRTSIYRDMTMSRFPQPKKIGGRLYWREDDVNAFIEEVFDAQ